MTAPAPDPIRVVLDAGQLPAHEVSQLLGGTGFGVVAPAVFDITGLGAVTSVQGLVTNDIEKPGDAACVYAALLTPKGMIRTDVWVLRDAGRVRLAAPPEGHAVLSEVLTRSLPPRLARFTDRTDVVTLYRLVGPKALDAAAAAGLPVPEAGRVATSGDEVSAVVVARPPAGPAPFALDVYMEHAGADFPDALELAGMPRLGAAVLDLGRILAGWPRLGAEIDDRTLPQEVRLDEIGGVSYTKGCYTGQETVARLHFRGHSNRGLVGLAWEDAPDPSQSHVLQDDKPLGLVTSIAELTSHNAWVGLAKVRRELDCDRPVAAAGARAEVVRLPMGFLGG